LGLAIAEIVDADTYDAAGRIMLAGRTLRESYELAFKHQRLWGDTERFSLRADTKALRIRFAHPGPSALARATLAEVALVEIMAAARLLVSPDVVAMGAQFVHLPLGPATELEATFGCRVRFGTRRNELALPTALADAPLRSRPELLQKVFEHEASRAQAWIPAQPSIVGRARAAARDWPTLPELAKRLALSPRTLQRKLREEGSSYFEVLDAMRREAVTRLTAQGLSDTRVALEVGFSDAGALARARRRWNA
jgi:AraC-like DNA-binding protein